MSKQKKPPAYFIRIRFYPEREFVTINLCRRDGAAISSLMWGEVLPKVAEQIAEASGLPTEIEHIPMEGAKPLPVPGCVTPAEQKTLFSRGRHATRSTRRGAGTQPARSGSQEAATTAEVRQAWTKEATAETREAQALSLAARCHVRGAV